MSDQNFESEEFTGNTSQMKNSPWLASEDILGLGEIELEIEGVHLNKDVPMDGGRKEKQLFSLSFKGRTKQLVLNATNRKAIAEQFGGNTKEWKGKKITLYVISGVRKPGGARGETCNGLRVKRGEFKGNSNLPDTLPEPK